MGDTSEGLTGCQIGEILRRLNIKDPFPFRTKRHRLFEALSGRQKNDNCGNSIVLFIKESMAPVKYLENKGTFESRRLKLNGVLSFQGMFLEENGELRWTDKVKTINEAQERAGRLRKNLIERKIHPDVLNFCKEEFLQNNYFHAVFEATKSVAEKIRMKSGLSEDGAELVDNAFNIKSPYLAINTLRTKTDLSEQKGFMNLLKGVFGTFRNVPAHIPKIYWTINEQDALDLLTIVSYLHRRLDNAVKTNL